MHKRFDHKEIEGKWQQKWKENDIYKTVDDSDKPKAFVLDMFPYPSGEGLHVGHPRGYIATDIYSRFKRMTGHEVLHPMGWDAFGLPAENYAIKNKVHPSEAVEKNVERFKSQLGLLGMDYDWDREVNTTDPNFYKWTQWIFIQLFKKGLAHESYEPINWCPGCQTGLANEDLEADGTCERCDSVVEQRPMRQWVLKIRDYADRMLADLDTLNWPEHIKEAQRNWIGRSEGAEIDFTLSTGDKVTIFTTRPDTLYGATYMVLAPEHPLVLEHKDTLSNWDKVSEYIKETQNKKEMDRLDDTKEKTGVKLEGITATNPASGEEIPVYIADYVLANYGTGAIMAVPGHSKQDFDFAFTSKRRSEIKFRQVIEPQFIASNTQEYDSFDFNGYSNKFGHEWDDEMANKGKIINSSKELDGLESWQIETITEIVGGRMTSTYKIKDWVFSRQRYWGEPIPIIHCEKCGPVAVPEDQLPVTLPDVKNYEPAGDGQSPLATIDDWVNTTCPECGDAGKRETNTMPQWAGSSWYYLRYMDSQNSEQLVSKENEKKWAPVDVYVGGDHAVRHLIYARFWHKFLYDIDVVSTIEPFQRLEFLGFILADDGRKMSKRWGNVINPDDIVELVGADTLRIYEMFMGPFENTIAWNQDGLVGARRFLERVCGLNTHITKTETKEVTSLLHKTIKKVSSDIEEFKFNTAISTMMIFVNKAEKDGITKGSYPAFLQLLAPFAPHITEELWNEHCSTDTIHLSSWPAFDADLAKSETITIGVQINGKVRGEITMAPDATEEVAMELVQNNHILQSKMKDFAIKKVIYVPGRILNIIVV